MNLMKKVNSLCKPAYLYLVVSVAVVLFLVVQNLLNGNMNELCAGTFSCNVSNVVLVLLVKVLYVVFWTVVLDAICKYGLKKLAWVLVLLPYILIGLMMVLK